MRSLIRTAWQMRQTVSRWLGATPASADFHILDAPAPDMRHGWQNEDLPEKQWAAFTPILESLRSGKTRKDFAALAEAVKSTGLDDPLIIEIGCGSGWNSEVLKKLLNRSIRYIGTDYSYGMVRLGKQHYTQTPFAACDAVSLPFADASCDILLSGTALMHIPEYREAIFESRRVSRRFAIFHTVPVHESRDTTVLKKRAYGEWVVEIVFNETQLVEVFRQAGFKIRHVLKSIPYDLVQVTGEHSVTKTYVCEAI
jgi:ubiquinone/menaquinone biosynthesis C-methylase UbiE